MNLFYEDYPAFIRVNNDIVPIRTDFREYIKLIDIIGSKDVTDQSKAEFICSFFLKLPSDMSQAIDRLVDFINMKELEIPRGRDEIEAGKMSGKDTNLEGESVKEVFSFKYDYAYILSGFLQCYRINLKTVDYMHWWEFRSLFLGLPAETEIKQRIQYRGRNLGKIKDKDERVRIQRIQDEIRLPGEELSDYKIADAFM